MAEAVRDGNRRVVDPMQFRNALKDFASGVTVVTAADSDGHPLGATVSAFTSLSLDPPLVLVCLARSSRTIGAIQESEAFAVHFLDRSQAALARAFAGDLVNKFDGEAYHTNDRGVPCLESCHRRLECRLDARYEGGDHIILVGLVEEAHHAEGFEPLLFSQRNFYGLGGQVVEA